MTPNQITLIAFLWIIIGLFVDYKRKGYNYITKCQLGWAQETPCRTVAFIFSPLNLTWILINKFIKTILTDEWYENKM